MKLHLPSGLRHALLACCAALPVSLPATIVSASILAGLCSFSQAATYSDKDVTLNSDEQEVIFSYDYTTHGNEEQEVTVGGNLNISVLRVNENTHTKLISGSAVTLTIGGSVQLANGSELILTSNNVRFANNTIFSQLTEGGTGKLVADFGASTTVQVHELLGGTYNTGVPIEVRSGTLKWVSGKVGANFSTITVTGGMVYLENMDNTFNSTIYLNPTNEEEVALVVSTQGGLGGNLYLQKNAAVAVSGNRTIHAAVNLQGHKLIKRNTDAILTISGTVLGAEDGSNIEVKQGTLRITGEIAGAGLQNAIRNSAFVVAQGATLNIPSLSGTGTYTYTSAGTLQISGNFSNFSEFVATNGGSLAVYGSLTGQGTLTFSSNSNFTWGENESASGTIGYQKLVFESGSTFNVNHVVDTHFATNITLNSSVLHLADTNGAQTLRDTDYLYFNTLEVSGSSRIDYQWEGGFDFSALTGEGSITMGLSVDRGNYHHGLTIKTARNYDGSILLKDASRIDYFRLYVNGVENSTLTIGAENLKFPSLKSSGFTMSGAGSSFTVWGNHAVTGDYTQSGGVATINGVETISGAMAVNSGSFTATGAVSAKSLQVGNGVDFTGGATLTLTEDLSINGGTLQVTNAAAVGGSLVANGGSVQASSTEIGGGVTLSEGAHFTIVGDATVGGDFSILDGSASIGGSHAISGKLELQSGSYEVEGDVKASKGFRMRGGELLNITGTLSVGKEFWMTHGGASASASIGGLVLADETVLRYGKGENLFSINDFKASGDLYVFTLNDSYFTREALSTDGVDLGIRDTVSMDSIFAMGYTRGEYTLEKKNGTWWIHANDTPHVDPYSTDGIWDANWHNELPNRPVGDSIPVVYRKGARELYMASDSSFNAPTMKGDAVWAQFNSASLPQTANIFGGVRNTVASQVQTDSWLDVVGGIYTIVAGASDVASGGKDVSFTGDTHVQLRGSAVAQMVVGANVQQNATAAFDGETFISIERGARVTGAVVGGSLFVEEHVSGTDGVPNTVNASSHIFIYTPLAASKDVFTIGTRKNSNVNQVVGGNYVALHKPGKTTFTGNSEIDISLGGAYGTFGKMIVGGDMIGIGVLTANDASSTNHVMTHEGSTSINITGAAGVTFTEAVVGGSYDPHALKIQIGTKDAPTRTHVGISSGTYRSMIIGGNATGNFGDTGMNRWANPAGFSELWGDTDVVLLGGAYHGIDLVSNSVTPDSAKKVTYSLGSIAVVGGSHDTNPATAVADSMTISGSTNVKIYGGTFYGHVVGGSVRQVLKEGDGRLGETTVMGGSHVSMLGGSMVRTMAGENDPINGVPRVVGGLLLDTPTSVANDNTNIQLGDTDVTIGGYAEVYDVIGGSWTVMLDAPAGGGDLASGGVKQGNISVTLQDAAVVRGDVYAGGIQGGTTKLTTESTKVTIGADVRFEKWDGSATIISGGYMNTRRAESRSNSGQWREEQSAFSDFYADDDSLSTVTGKSQLVFDSAGSYGNHLANAWLLNFDTVALAEGASVTVGALVNADGEAVTLSGDGTLSMTADLITPTSGEQRMNNSFMKLTKGAALHLLRSAGDKQLTYLQGVEADEGSRITIDLAQEGAKNDILSVAESITMEGGDLTLNINVTESMLTRGVIRKGSYGGIEPRALVDPTTVVLNGTQLHVNIDTIDSKLLTGDVASLHIIEGLQGSYDLSADSLATLEKWFKGPVSIKMKDGNLDISGETVSVATVDYHSRRALSANGAAGARLLDNLYVTLNPEGTDAGGDRAAMLNELERKFATGSYKDADRVMAAAAGSALPTLGQALDGDVERQLRGIRNRTTTMGLNSDCDYGDLPRLQFWVNGEGDFRKMKEQDSFAGYRVNSWGGTVGMSADITASDTVGLALTAMYGDIQSFSEDKMKGDTSNCYLSAFWRSTSSAWTHTVVGTIGIASADVNRTVNYGSGSYSTKASPDGYAAGLLYEVGYSFVLDEDGTMCAQPVLNITWKHTRYGTFSESGSDAALEVNSIGSDSVSVGAGLRAQALVGGELLNHSGILEGRVLAKGYAGNRQSEAEVGFKGAAHKEKVKSREAGAFGVELGAGLVIPMDRDALFFDVSAELRNAETNFNATVGYRMNF